MPCARKAGRSRPAAAAGDHRRHTVGAPPRAQRARLGDPGLHLVFGGQQRFQSFPHQARQRGRRAVRGHRDGHAGAPNDASTVRRRRFRIVDGNNKKAARLRCRRDLTINLRRCRRHHQPSPIQIVRPNGRAATTNPFVSLTRSRISCRSSGATTTSAPAPVNPPILAAATGPPPPTPPCVRQPSKTLARAPLILFRRYPPMLSTFLP